MTKRVKHNGKWIQYYGCNDCGMVYHMECGLRPNNKFCDKDCMDYVLSEGLTKWKNPPQKKRG